MNTSTLMGRWGLLKEKLKQRFDNLTDNDLAYIKDREYEVLGHIQAKTGASREELDRWVREACASSG
jgi:uncharacterized protein YjbJ (UPF0337 family)